VAIITISLPSRNTPRKTLTATHSESSNGSLSDVFKGDAMQAFEVNGNEIAEKSDAIRYAKAIAEECGRPVMIWQSGLPVLWIAPEIKIGRETLPV
jgi:hypothetical protein